MRRVGAVPCRVHLLVCANQREPGGLPSCGPGGQWLFDALKARVLRAGRSRDVWVTWTRCLGYCHKDGATLAIYRPGQGGAPVFLQAVRPDELEAVLRAEVPELASGAVG